MEEIPLIDFSKISESLDKSQVNKAWEELTDQIRSACHDIGFLYIINHGIPAQTINGALKESLNFFNLPLDTKKKYLIDPGNKFRGYSCPGQEMLSPNSACEYREAFALVGMDSPQSFPNTEVPNFRPAMMTLQYECNHVVNQLLKLMARALFLDPFFFVEANKGLENPGVGNRCTLRTHYYPPIPTDTKIPVNSVRCGAHTDYGCITLLFQDDLGGLEVLNAKGKWIPAEPIQNSILVNLGDIMEKWTGSYFKATCHRVLIPELERRRRTCRQSIAYFVQTDDEYIVQPIKSELIPEDVTFEPFSFEQYLQRRIGNTYQY